MVDRRSAPEEVAPEHKFIKLKVCVWRTGAASRSTSNLVWRTGEIDRVCVWKTGTALLLTRKRSFGTRS